MMQNNVKKNLILSRFIVFLLKKTSNICLQNSLKHCDGVSQGNIVMF